MSIKTDFSKGRMKGVTNMLTWEELYDWCYKHRTELKLIHNTESVGENLTYTEYGNGKINYITVEHWNIVSDGSAQYINKKLVYVHGNYKPCLTVKV